MRLTMDCARAEELLSDDREGTLAPAILDELEAHLAACTNCRTLREAITEVLEALRTGPLLDPPLSLAERAATSALTVRRSVGPQWTSTWPIPGGLQAAAAVLALAVTGVVWSATVTSGATNRAARLAERTVNAGAYVSERAERIIEDVRILRIVLATAFGGRVEGVNDRIEDYKRLLERPPKEEPKKSGAEAPAWLVAGGDVKTRSEA